ncbi:MAG: ATP-binding cassette domain-containing protein [Bacilli bacterium]|nr:ATP-binding cassette domain-containing protein [Bacilli bacterium]MDD4406968.1 ATP-binding cassette domain-containing protein [Bacilli bacterium]
MEKYAITVDDLHISYKGLKKMSIRSTFFNKKNKEKVDIIKAVNGVSLKIEKGKILGIIGKNGSGKSTMLRAIAGIFSPDKGSINLYGNSISLLSIGVGFNKKLTGRENIYLSGLLLGFTEDEIRKKEKQIIDFADIGKFIYKPVRMYSTGMHSKLAFAITAILETDIMLIDEVLSVGDIQFRKKSYNKMKELISAEHRTVIIVSHSTENLKELCDEVLWLHNGKIKMIGKPEEVLKKYEEFMGN